MKTLLLIAATLLLSQHAFANEDYLCTIKSSRSSIVQAVSAVALPDVETNLQTSLLKGVSAGNSFMASIVHDKETESEVLDIAINYSASGSSFELSERLYKKINIDGSREYRTKGVDANSKIPLLKATKTNLMSDRTFGSIKKNAKGFSGNLRLELETNDKSYSQIVKFDCKPSL